eukprot:7156799-Heterocapsa_arctica.AAC.1
MRASKELDQGVRCQIRPKTTQLVCDAVRMARCRAFRPQHDELIAKAHAQILGGQRLRGFAKFEVREAKELSHLDLLIGQWYLSLTHTAARLARSVAYLAY